MDFLSAWEAGKYCSARVVDNAERSIAAAQLVASIAVWWAMACKENPHQTVSSLKTTLSQDVFKSDNFRTLSGRKRQNIDLAISLSESSIFTEFVYKYGFNEKLVDSIFAYIMENQGIANLKRTIWDRKPNCIDIKQRLISTILEALDAGIDVENEVLRAFMLHKAKGDA